MAFAFPAHASLTNKEQSGNIEDEKCIWRVIDPASYVELQSFSVNGMTVDRQQSATPVIASVSPANATWAAAEDFLYTTYSSLISIDNDNHTIKGITSGTATVTATHKSGICSATFTVKVNKNAIIIIPGIMGSELFLGDNTNAPFENGTPIWTASVFAEMQGIGDLSYIRNIFKSLRCNDDATSKYNVYTKRFTTKAELTAEEAEIYSNQCGTEDIYRNLFTTLNQNNFLTSKYTIDFFSYDWRLSNGISAQKLDSYINEMGYDNVVLLGHSMGGLVASGYLALGENQRNKVRAVYYLASPLLGSVEMVNVWFDEDISALNLDSQLPLSSSKISSICEFIFDPLTNLLSSYQSIYELTPTEKYFSLIGSYFARKIIYPNLLITEEFYETYNETKQSFGGFSGYKNALMSNAEAFHNSLYINEVHISAFVDSYYLYGNGESTKTKLLHALEYYNLDDQGNSYIHSTIIEQENTTEGDGLVAKWSAALAGQYPNRTYYMNAPHTGIIDKLNTTNFIIQNILGNYQHNSSNSTFINGY